MLRALRRRWKVVVPAGAALAGVAAWLVFGVFAFHLVFVDDKVDEAAPVFDRTMATAPTVSSPTVPPAPTPRTVAGGEFSSRSHPTSGRAVVLTDGGDRRVLRFEDFRTDNGPDVDVYLSNAAPDAPAGQLDDDYVRLGDLKGNVGNQNYEIPAGVDLTRYRTVVIWCVRFSVAFGVAPLA